VTTRESEAILERIAGNAVHKIELDLERLPALLERLGQPHLKLPKVVHFAGTNGKGSTLAFVKAMLRHSGKLVQAFTSPHLLRVTEEIELAGGEIADDRLAGLLRRVEEMSDGIAPTAYEALAAAAFLAFSEDRADFLLLETAMGGRLDVTNVVPDPAVTAITPVARDHMAFLGDTISAIATEKAGILKPSAVCVANPQHPDAIEVVTSRASSLGVPLRLLLRDFSLDDQQEVFSGRTTFSLPALGLPGRHQRDNAALALAVMEEVEPDLLPDAAIGLAEAVWPCRLQCLQQGSPEIWCDGGHNPHAAAALSSAISEMPPRKLVMIVAMLDNRPLDQFLEAFRPLDPLIIGIPLPGKPVYAVGEGFAPAQIAATARQLGLEAIVANSVQEAMSTLPDSAEKRVLITGSLYLAGRAAEDISNA
jgi:dihydrofolate synthase/folylpolyglutamate synthase